MPHEVKMPQLGMAQETGRLVAWLKAPGDKVSADEMLMEVETDKSVMEVPAGADGILADIRAQAGEDVPVGAAVALIRLSGESEEQIAPEIPQKPEPQPVSAAAEAVKPVPPVKCTQPPPVPAARSATSGPILASPKARRLAMERGIDLGRAVAAGLQQPIHVADLKAAAAMQMRAGSGVSLATARCDRNAFDAFLAAMADQTVDVQEPHVVAARFVAASLRAVRPDGPIAVAVEAGPSLNRVVYVDPDRFRATRPKLASPDTPPDIILRDLTASRLTMLALARDTVPALTLGADGAFFTLSLSFPDSALEAAAAIHVLTSIAGCFEAPMENLV